jgi:hypothetical protein
LNVDCVTLYTLQASSFDCPSTTITTTAQTINTNKKFMLMNNAAINRNWSEYRIEPRATIVLVPLSLCRCQLLLMPMRLVHSTTRCASIRAEAPSILYAMWCRHIG